MTDLATNIDLQPHTDTGSPTAEVPHAPALITEQQVLLGSTAALAGPKVRRHYFARVRAMLISGRKSELITAPTHYPKHHEFIETALMSRMMERL